MRPPPVWTSPPAPGLARREWLRRVAHRVAQAPARSAALFEWETGRPTPRVAASPAWTVPDRPPGEPPTPAPHPPLGWAVRFGVLMPPIASSGGIPPDGGDGSRLSPTPAPWSGAQVFWVPDGTGRLLVAARFRVAAPRDREAGPTLEAGAAALAFAWSRAIRAAAVTSPAPLGTGRDWAGGSGRRIPAHGWWCRAPEEAARAVEWDPVAPSGPGFGEDGHALLFGSSGAGKTTTLAQLVGRAVGRGLAAVVIDLHGDLVPAVLARLSPSAARQAVVVDATRRPVPGIAALAPGLPPERAAAHLVAAVKRLSPDGLELHWGFRLERIVESFARLAIETDGSVADVVDLLTDPRRRDAARYSTRQPDLARFLEELEPIVRRSPDFLWPAASRLTKVVAVPALTELLAPPDGGLPVERLLREGRPLLVRLPFPHLGPEAAAFAGSVVLGRLYLGLAVDEAPGARPPILFVLDELQAFSPRLVGEMFAESRKFGVRLLAATQFPDRLAVELRAAAAGSARHVGSLRVSPGAARTVGPWLGLSFDEAERRLPDLPTGHALVRDPESGELRHLPGPRPGDPAAEGLALAEGAERTRSEFEVRGRCSEDPDPEPVRALLLSVLAGEEMRAPLDPGSVEDRLQSVGVGAGAGVGALAEVERQRWVERAPDGLHLTPAGARRLGAVVDTGATRESAEHRALVVAAFRIFARHGALLEIVRQGRFDTTLPDGRFRQLPTTADPGRPLEIWAAIERARPSWAWRYFGGRDVHVEAEVSGATRPDRIRRGLAKARRRGAFCLFVVSTDERARRVRATLRTSGSDRASAGVWVLRVPRSTEPGRGDEPRL